jgi:hypothetical protein
VQRLRELGWIKGRTIAIEVRWAEGRSERFAEIAASSTMQASAFSEPRTRSTAPSSSR